jgi:type IV pilus assembly protein PilY1
MMGRRNNMAMRVGAAIFAVLLCSSGLLAPDAHAQRVTPKPSVLILLDSSGSMEYAVDRLDEEGHVPVCHETRQAGFDYVKSRWVVAAEVLTGAFNDYWCSYDFRNDDPDREDYMYVTPHVVPHGTVQDGSSQRPDGLLDLFGDTIKFGLMTFDSRLGSTADQEGGYSYGPTKEWGGFQINLGARHSQAPWGGMVSPALDEAVDSLRTANQVIEAQILASTPYLGTPISPLLEDALYFFSTDPHGRPYSEASEDGDPYFDCRSKNIVLITDGQPTLGEGIYGYGTSAGAAQALAALGVKIYVVGFQMPETTFPILDSIASAGGTEAAYIVTSQAEFLAVMGQILVQIQGNQTARVKTVITNRTMNLDDRQYQFNASYGASQVSPLDLVGHLEQDVYRCDPGCAVSESWGGASLCEVFSISNALAERNTPRTITTQLGGVLLPFSAANAAITDTVLEIPTSGSLPRLDPYENPDGTVLYTGISLGDASDSSVRSQYREQLIRLIRAEAGSRREGIPMGAISRSQPVVQANLFNMAAPIPSFVLYRNKEEVRTRPTALFVGTHDGMLRAFRVDRHADLAESDYGQELWSFIPKHLLPQLKRLASGAAFLLDGSPVVQEVRLHRKQVQADVEEERDLWRSVLVTGYGDGGRGYVALDVTNPVEPAFMWEISNTEWCYAHEGGTACTATTAFERLGLSRSVPAIGTVFIETAGSMEERAVVVFGGGRSVEDEADSGLAVFVVNLETGALIREFCNDCGNVTDTNSGVLFNLQLLDRPLEGNVVAYDTSMARLMTRAFIGDSAGQLWRLNLMSPSPEDWRLEFFHDAYTILPPMHPWRRPVVLSPALSLGTDNGLLVVLYGTGDPDVPLRPGWGDRVYSVSERWNGSGYEGRTNWGMILDPGESYTSEPLVFNRTAYFTTQTSTGGLCNIGSGRLWGVDYIGDDPNSTTDVVARLDEDGDASTEDTVLYKEYPGSDLLGLQLVQRPSCFAQPTDFMPWLGGDSAGTTAPAPGSPLSVGGGTGDMHQGASSGALELMVQTGATGESSPQLQPPGGSGSSATGNRAALTVQRPGRAVFSTSWGMVFD